MRKQGELISFLFSGQGFESSQVKDIKKRAKAYPLVSELFENIFQEKAPTEDNLSKDKIKLNHISAYIIILSSLYWLKKSEDLGIIPDYVSGYSIGQYAALYKAGVISLESYVEITFKRCKIMNEVSLNEAPGSMIVILGLKEEAINQIILDNQYEDCLEISIVNAPGNFTISGEKQCISELKKIALKAGALKAEVLNTSGAWHCFKMQKTIPKLKVILENYLFNLPNIEILDNVTGSKFPRDLSVIKERLCQHMISRVEWKKTITNLINENVNIFLEISDFDLLTNMGHFISRRAKFIKLEKFD